MMTNSPINSANDLMRSIASAMDALLAFWRHPSPTQSELAGIRNAVDFIDANYAVLRDLEPQVREYIEDAWNNIIVNDMQRLSIRRLTNTCKTFFGKCVELENVWNEHEESTFELFNDEWRARKYVVLCHESLQKHKDTHEAAAKDMNRSFIIPSRRGIHRNLSLSGDTPKYTESQYPIWECISRYKELQKDGGMSE